jgi:hypothetical protein
LTAVQRRANVHTRNPCNFSPATTLIAAVDGVPAARSCMDRLATRVGVGAASPNVRAPDLARDRGEKKALRRAIP